MICFRDHASELGGRWRITLEPRSHDLSTWILCGLSRSCTAITLLVAAGVLRADSDGGLLYWQAAFWRPFWARKYALGAIRKALE